MVHVVGNQDKGQGRRSLGRGSTGVLSCTIVLVDLVRFFLGFGRGGFADRGATGAALLLRYGVVFSLAANKC